MGEPQYRLEGIVHTKSGVLEDFEGPLDVIFELLSKNKIEIQDVSISAILEQYLGYLDEMKRMDMEIASEFLEMAAQLVYIKSVMLLPRHEEETEEFKRELTGQLIEYQLCQQMARRLAADYVGGDLFVRPAEEVEPDLTYRRAHRPEEMLDAYLAAAGRGKRRLPPPAQAFSGIVSRKIVSVSSRIGYVLRRLYTHPRVTYASLFEQAESKSELVATFLALLELIKSKRIAVEDSDSGLEIEMRPRDDWDETIGEEFDDDAGQAPADTDNREREADGN